MVGEGGADIAGLATFDAGLRLCRGLAAWRAEPVRLA